MLNLKNADKITYYEKPLLISLAGNIGSGKSTLSRYFSEELGIYIISNDYERGKIVKQYSLDENKYNQLISKWVIKQNFLKMLQLKKNNISFIIDANVNSYLGIQYLKKCLN